MPPAAAKRPARIPARTLSFRPLQETDFPYIVRWSQDPEIDTYMDGGYPENLEECRTWYGEEVAHNRNRRFFMILLGQEPIGGIELDHISWRAGEAELRVCIGRKELWNQGYGTEAVMAILTWAFTQTRLRHIYLRVYSFNLRAQRCYEKCGFRRRGSVAYTARRSHQTKEIILMSITRQDFLHHTATYTSARAVAAGSERVAARRKASTQL